MTLRGPAFLRFLAGWDQDAATLQRALAERAGHPVVFSEPGADDSASALVQLFDRDPLDAVTQREDGTWLLPYHPWEAYRRAVEERYLGPPSPPLHARIPLPYHWVPGPLRLGLYPLIAGSPSSPPEAQPPDPAWPIEGRLDAFRATLYDGVTPDSGSHQKARAKAPVSGPWPGGKRFPLLMTHDIDTKRGLRTSYALLDEMVAIGLKPCFFLVGKGYAWDPGFCSAVQEAGGEIALHGARHDNRIAYLSAEKAGQRLDGCKDLIDNHGIRGFRSPSLLVSDPLYDALSTRFSWDSSVPDTDTHTLLGVRRGCGTLFPFRRRGLVVLPTTMPADDRLLLLGYEGLRLIDVLRRKWLHVRETGGLCHFLTHPEPHLFGKRLLRDLYRALLGEILDGGDAWVATPSMVADYWLSLAEPAPGDGSKAE